MMKYPHRLFPSSIVREWINLIEIKERRFIYFDIKKIYKEITYKILNIVLS